MEHVDVLRAGTRSTLEWLFGRRRTTTGLALARTLRAALADAAMRRAVLAGKFNVGECPICERPAAFVRLGEWLRDEYLCATCRSIPRNRALVVVLDRLYPEWRDLQIHESSPGGASSDKLKVACKRYTSSYFYPDVEPGAHRNGVRCENLERLTFEDAAFDIVVTQDVFEHVLDPAAAFGEIARVLRPGGAHVFTVPFYPSRRSVVRAVPSPDGVTYLAPKEYHANPIDPAGSLVVTEWGADVVDVIYANSGMTTTIYSLHDKRMGLEAAFLEVFVSVKPRRD
jgi:hypothetical protein